MIGQGSVTNQLLVGDPRRTIDSLPPESIDLVWLDGLQSMPACMSSQLNLFETVNDPAYEGIKPAFDVLAVVDAFAPVARRILNDSGTLFVSAPARLSHRVRLLLDSTFGPAQFRAEIPIPTNEAPTSLEGAGLLPKHAVVIVYSKTGRAILEFDERTIESRSNVYRHMEAGTGRRYTLADCTSSSATRAELTYEWHGTHRTWRWTRVEMERLDASGRIVHTRSGLPRIKRYHDEVAPRNSVSLWKQTQWLGARLDNEGPNDVLVRRIIETGSKVGDTLLDVNALSSRVLVAAHEIGRRWIALARDHRTSTHIRNSLRRDLGDLADDLYDFSGPRTSLEAQQLAAASPDEFKSWVLGTIGALATKRLRHTDAGIDGRLWLDGVVLPIPITTKLRALRTADFREAEALLRKEKAALIVLVTTTRAMPRDPRTNQDVSKKNVCVLTIDDLLGVDRRRLLLRLRDAAAGSHRRMAKPQPLARRKRFA